MIAVWMALLGILSKRHWTLLRPANILQDYSCQSGNNIMLIVKYDTSSRYDTVSNSSKNKILQKLYN